MARFGDLWIPWVMAAERNMVTADGLWEKLPTDGTGSWSGQRLKLLQLATHFIDRLVQLLNPFLQEGINRCRRWGWLQLAPGAGINLDGWLTRGFQPQRLGTAALAATIRFRQQPPTQPGSPEYGSTEGAQQQAAAGAGWALPWISHGWVDVSTSP